VRSGELGWTIVDLARDQAADLLVVGAPPLKDLEQVVIGSTVERVVRAAPCAVLVVKADRSVGDQVA
jgi:nucleotide-binding universal stress UspA family protein